MLLADNIHDQFKSYTKPLHPADNASSAVPPHSSPLEAFRGRDVCNTASKFLCWLRTSFWNLVIGRLCILILLAFASCAFDVRRTQPLIFWIPVQLASPPIVRYTCCLFNIFFCRTSAFLAPEFSHRYIPITLVRSRKTRWCNSSFFESTELFDLGERINFELFLRRVLSLRWRFWPTLLGRYFIVMLRDVIPVRLSWNIVPRHK